MYKISLERQIRVGKKMPCPFCGITPRFQVVYVPKYGRKGIYSIMCKNVRCKAMPEIKCRRSLRDLVKAWNHRVVD